MKRIIAFYFVFMLTACVYGNASWAQEKGNIELMVAAETEIEVINANGERELKRVKAAKVIPGDTVIYTIYYNNISEETAENVFISNPIPKHMLYRDRTAIGAGALTTFSVNDGKSYDVPENIKVIGINGKERPARPSDYTHIRWTLQNNLAPGKKGSVSYRTILQ